MVSFVHFRKCPRTRNKSLSWGINVYHMMRVSAYMLIFPLYWHTFAWLFKRCVKVSAEAPVELGTLHMPIRGHSFRKHSCLRGQTHVACVCVCFHRFPGDRIQLPHNPRPLHCLCGLLADHKDSTYWDFRGCSRLGTTDGRSVSLFAYFFFYPFKDGTVGGSKQVSHDWNHNRFLMVQGLRFVLVSKC